jgi:ketosteroid isomerase-like protein
MAQPRETVEQFYRRLDADGPAAIRDLIAEDCVFVRPGVTLPPGPDAFMGWLGSFMAALPDHRHRLERWIEEGDRVAYEVIGTGTFTAPLETPDGVVPPTGRSLNFKSGAISEVRDGKLTYDAFYFDQMSVLGQLGVLPEHASRG